MDLSFHLPDFSRWRTRSSESSEVTRIRTSFHFTFFRLQSSSAWGSALHIFHGGRGRGQLTKSASIRLCRAVQLHTLWQHGRCPASATWMHQWYWLFGTAIPKGWWFLIILIDDIYVLGLGIHRFQDEQMDQLPSPSMESHGFFLIHDGNLRTVATHRKGATTKTLNCRLLTSTNTVQKQPEWRMWESQSVAYYIVHALAFRILIYDIARSKD